MHAASARSDALFGDVHLQDGSEASFSLSAASWAAAVRPRQGVTTDARLVLLMMSPKSIGAMAPRYGCAF
jgi:hypothetical protein